MCLAELCQNVYKYAGINATVALQPTKKAEIEKEPGHHARSQPEEVELESEYFRYLYMRRVRSPE